jgi:hypothetical protein
MGENKQQHFLSEKHQSVMTNVLCRTIVHQIDTESDQQLIFSQMDLDLPHTTISTSRANDNQLYENLDVLLGGVQVLNDDMQHFSSQSLSNQCALRTVSEELSKIQLAIEETNACVEGLTPNQQILQQDFASLKQRVVDQQSASYDGTLIWKITNVQEKIGM